MGGTQFSILVSKQSSSIEWKVKVSLSKVLFSFYRGVSEFEEGRRVPNILKSRCVGSSCGHPDKVSIGEVAILEAAILNVVSHPVAKLDTPE